MLTINPSSSATVVTVGGGATVTCPAVPTATYTTPPTGVSFGNWSRGSGVSCASANDGINGRGFNVAGAATAYSSSKYYKITITADSTHSFTLSSVTWLATISSGSGTLTVYTSNNGGAATIFGSPATSVNGSSISATFNGNVVVAPGTSVDVYFIPSDLSAGTTTCRYKNGSTFTVTAGVAPTVSSSAATEIGSTTATLNGSVDSDGGSAIIERGFVYRVGTGVTITDNRTAVAGTTGAYTLSLITLSPSTLYSFRAYAINAAGTSLSSPELAFTTSATATAPIVDSPTSSAIGVTTATLGATVESDDGVSIDDYGIVWGLSANPTTADNKIQKGTSTTPPQTFTVSATGLNAATLIHYRGYAHSSVGTGYTADASFSTLSTEPTLQASAVTFTGVGESAMTINFVSGNGSSRIVLVKSGSAVDSDPVDGTTYTASATFGSGSQIGTGNLVVFAGSGNSVTVGGLSPSTVYYVAVYEFNGFGGTENYLTTSPAINYQQTTPHVAATYTWNQTGSADWTTAANWTPARTTPATDDVLLFNNGANTTVSSVPAQTIGKLQVSGNTTVNLQAGAVNTLTIAAAAADALTVASGSQLNVNGASALAINLAGGAKGSISGSMTFSTATNRLTATDPIGITFNSGSTFTQAAGNNGNVFGSAGTANAIVFASGSTFVSQAGANPFGLGEPNSKVIFQTGSLYSHQQVPAPSFSGRTYADFELDVNATITVTGSNAVSMDDLTINQGTLNFNMTGTPDHSIKGDITVANGATLTFTPATPGTVNLNGSSLQTIGGGGTMNVSTNSTIVIDNPAGISLQKSIVVDGAITLADGIVTCAGSNLLTVSSAGAMSGGSASSYFDPRVAQVYSGTGPRTFPIGNGGNFRPLALNSTQAGASTITVEQFESALTGALPTNTCRLENRFWTVTRAEGSSFTYDITLNAPGFTPANPLILKRDGSIVSFAATQAGSSFTVTGLASLSDFAMGETCTPPTATVSGDQTICTGGSAIIQALMTGTGPWSITWSDGVTNSNFGDNPHTRAVNPTSSTTYTVTAVSDSTGIPGGTSSGSATVTVNPQPTGPTLVSKSPNLSAVCDGQSVSATFTPGSGGVGCSDSYQFSTDNGATYGPYVPGNPISTSGSTGVIIQGKRDGCASGTGCTGTPFTTLASWTVNPPPTCSITPPGATVCSGQTQQFCAPAGVSSYSWTGPGGFAASSPCITVSTAGTYTVTIVDGGCTNSCQTTLSVNTGPTLTCPSDLATTNDAGLCSASVTFSPTFTGSLECRIGATVITSPHVFEVGTTTVSCTTSNDCGTTNCSFKVIVNDAEPPAITGPANVLTNTATGLCVVSNVVLGVPISTNDNCGVATVVNDAPGDLTFGAGTNHVIWTATDIHGNQTSATQLVIVADTEAPTISGPPTVLVNADAGLCTASGVNLGVPVSTNDNCGVGTVVSNAPAAYPVGTNDVIWTVTDIHGNSATCTQQVIVVDNQNPTIACPGDITVTNTTVVTWSLDVRDNCPGVTSRCSPTNGSTFAVGTTGVTCTATDASGNTTNCSFNVTVITNIAVTIACPADISVPSAPGQCSSNLPFAVTATGFPTPSVQCRIGATVVTSPYLFPVGINTVDCTASNQYSTATCSFTVTIQDTEAPTISCPPTVTVNADNGLCTASGVNLGVPSATSDNCGIGTVVNNAPASYPVGTNNVIWTVTDIHGNSATCTQKVIVVDNQNPAISCPPTVTVNTDNGLCTASGVNLGVPSVTSDNCGIGTVVNNAPASYPVGTNNVIWTVTDIHGNSATCTQTVIVVDNQAPTITCPADITLTNSTTASWSLGVSDNCPGVTSRCSPTNGSTFAVGSTGVTCTATDANGNTTSCSFNVMVVTNGVVTVTCPGDVTAPNAPGQCSSNLPFAVTATGFPTPSVECRIGTNIITSPYAFGVGTNTVDCTASNQYSTATCSFTVTIQDTEAPTISCPPAVTVNTDNGLCTASDIDLGQPLSTSDNCGVSTVVNNAPAAYPIGTNAVIWTVTDIHGNSATCTQTVIVVDNQAPTITCPANVVTSADPGRSSKSNVTYTAVAADNCTNVTVSCTPASGSTFAIGTNSVTCLTIDGSGNTNNCAFTVTILDDEPPVVSCPTNIVAFADSAQCTKSNVTYSATAGDNGPNVTLSCSPSSGSTLPAGTTTVYVNATDASGNSAAIKTFGNIHTAAGNGVRGSGGDGGAATNAYLNSPYRVAVDYTGNLFIADLDNQRVRRVDAATGIITTVAGNGVNGYSGDGGAATNASLGSPTDVAVDYAGNLFIADFYNSRIRRVDAATGIITTVAGNGVSGYSGDGGAATNASVNSVYGVAVDYAGNLFIADTGNSRIRRVDAATGIITTVAGNGGIGFSGDGGAATNARVNGPFDVAVDRAGNLFIADFYNARIRRVDATTGIITTVAGTGSSGYRGDGGPATSAKLYGPFGVALDGSANLFVADWFNYRVRRVDAITGIITTVAGNGGTGYSGDGGPATTAGLTDPTDVAVDRAGNLLISELNGQRVRRVDAVAACTFTVTVTETAPPSITCPSNIVTNTTAGTCVASNVTWTAPAANNCTNVTTSCTPASGSAFAIGTTSVTCTATDSSGNTNSCSFTVTVIDNGPPVISVCVSNQTLSAGSGCQAALPDLTGQLVATDSCGGTPTVIQSPAAGTLLGLGTNSVSFTVDDGRGNSNSCTAMVIVRDVTPPVIQCTAEITVNANPGVCFATGVSLGTVTVSDNCSVAAVTSNAPASFPVGTNAVIWTAIDPSGNTATCTQQVVVLDSQAPVISCPADVVVKIPFGATHARGVALSSPVASDNCGVVGVANDASSCFAVGTNTVVWTALDANGNSSTCTQRVIVVPVAVSSNYQIQSIKAIGQNILLTWQTFGSSTNIVQTVTPVFGGNYTNHYDNAASVWVPGAGLTITNWTDYGGATNRPSRYYRIGLQVVDPSCGP
ncbi:MAG TPA: HYR domain-containing protein [Verrucomicrobiae bacterium]|nr:HYR domain-containing protein [Verrucomicrobiae bacterium]